MYQVKIYNSLTELKKEDWDVLTENNICMCYEYLKTFEETNIFPLQPHYITINDQTKIIGASVCHFEQKNDARIIDRVILGRLHQLRLMKKISFYPSVICNRQRGDGTHFIFHPELKQEQVILLQNKILDEIERIAENNKASVCFMNVTKHETPLANILIRRGYYKSFDLPTNFMDVKWSTFEEYKKFLSKKYPYMNKSIRHQLNRNRKSGVIIKKLQNINGHEERLLELLKMNHFKYNSSEFPLKPNYFRRVKENFENNTVIYVAIKDGIIIGVTVQLKKGEEAFFPNGGVDHELSKNDLTFFNLAYYEPIKNAADYKIKRIYHGRGLYKTKIKRGCITEDMLIYYKPRNIIMKPIIKLWFVFHKRWMMRKLAYIKKL